MKFVHQTVPATPERVFAFHELPDALAQLTPPWERVRVVTAASSLAVGSRALIELRIFGIVPTLWEAVHTAYEPPFMFEDVQVRGPIRSWRHRHVIEAHAAGALLRDDIDYEPPAGLPGRVAARWLVEPRLRKMFEYRHRVTRAWCESAADTPRGV